MAMGKIAQPFGQRACSHQRLPVKHNLHVNIQKVLKNPLRAGPFNSFIVETQFFLGDEPFFRVFQFVKPL